MPRLEIDVDLQRGLFARSVKERYFFFSSGFFVSGFFASLGSGL